MMRFYHPLTHVNLNYCSINRSDLLYLFHSSSHSLRSLCLEGPQDVSNWDLIELLELVGPNLTRLEIEDFPATTVAVSSQSSSQSTSASSSSSLSSTRRIRKNVNTQNNRKLNNKDRMGEARVMENGMKEEGYSAVNENAHLVDSILEICPKLKTLDFLQATASPLMFEKLKTTRLERWRFTCASAIR